MPCFYSLTLESQGSILTAIQGSYSVAKAHEIVVNRGRYLELFRFDLNTGQIHTVCCTDTFSLIRSISNLRIMGSGKDMIVTTSDSGNIVILDFNKDTNQFERIHSEPYGKSGFRRIIPGHYLAVDPIGRSIMIAAIERQKLVYTLIRKNKEMETIDISSPMEAHKGNMICFSLTALDVGYDNPIFATIEQCYLNNENDLDFKTREMRKQLIFWEVDLGLNYVSRKSSQVISDTSHLLLSVPGGADGPSGVIVCDNAGITYCKIGHQNLFCPYPMRFGEIPESGIIIVASALHKLRNFFFILIQTELGDIYRVQFLHNEGLVQEIKMYYYDTIPVCNSLVVLRSGYLFAAHEFGNHSNYQFLSLGDDETDPYTSSLNYSLKNCELVYFRPRNCSCIKKIEELPSLSPIIDMKVIDCNNDGSSQIIAACGRGARSTLRICSYGKNVEEITENPLPGRPRFIWTLKKGTELSLTNSISNQENYHCYIIISFIDRSLVLSIGEHVEETNETLFTLNETTIHAASMIIYNSFIQVLESHVKLISNERVFDWKTPEGRKIVAADSNGRQVALALEGGLIIILELNISGMSLNSQNSITSGLIQLCSREITCEIICIGIQQLTYADQLRSDYVAVGTSTENTVRLYSINASEKRLKQTSTQVLPTANSIPESVILYHSVKYNHLYLFIGLTTGVILSCKVDVNTGSLNTHRSKYLGHKGVNMSRIIRDDFSGEMSILCMTNKPWIIESQMNRINYTPLQYRNIDSIAPLNTHQVSNGYVAVSGATLVIFQIVHNYGESFSQNTIQLNYTPRKILILPPPQLFTGLETLIESGTLDIPKDQMIAVIESDHNTFDYRTKKEIVVALKNLYDNNHKQSKESKNIDNGQNLDSNTNDQEINMELVQDENINSNVIIDKFSDIGVLGENGTLLPESEIGGFIAGEGRWGGCVRVINLKNVSIQQVIPLDVNEGCISSCICKFDEMDLPCLILGTVYGMKLRDKSNHNETNPFAASIKIYKYDSNFNFELVHSTPVEDAITAMTGWRGRLLVGINKTLRVYSLGKKRLLRKSEYRNIPEGLSWLKIANDRIFAGDITNGVLVFKYNDTNNQFVLVAKDSMPKWLTSACEVLDYHTVAASDKFDNIFVSRVPIEASDDYCFTSSFVDNNGSSFKSHQMNSIAQFHIGDIVTCIQKTQLSTTSAETIIYGTILGSIGSLTPITNNDDIDLLTKLEILLRKEKVTLLSRDHLMFRSYYSPVHNVIDGDFCQLFTTLSQQTQSKIASKLNLSAEEIFKKLDDLKTRLF